MQRRITKMQKFSHTSAEINPKMLKISNALYQAEKKSEIFQNAQKGQRNF